MTTQEGQKQESGAAGKKEGDCGAVEWGGFVISHIERDLNAVEAGQQEGQEDEVTNQETAQAPEVGPPPSWTEGLKAHLKDKGEEEGMKEKSKRARKKCRQKERKRMMKMGCGCSGASDCIARPPGILAKTPGKATAKGTGAEA